ncbi:MAG: hypothetical protein U0574_10090 [Phycisphaerales bacterium]
MRAARTLWARIGEGAGVGQARLRAHLARGGLERGVWIAATVLLAIPIFALLLVAIVAAAALTLAAALATVAWSGLRRLGLGPRSDPEGRRNVRVIRTPPR